MNGMVERVARAIKSAIDAGTHSEKGTATFDDLSRAAIAAMREPTEVMVDGADMAITASDDGECWEALSADVWRTMIDAALAD